MDHGEAGDEGLHLVVVAEAAGEDKHVAGEEGVPGAFRHHPHGEPVAPVCPGVEVLDVKVPLGEVLDHPLVEGFKGLRGEGLVHLSHQISPSTSGSRTTNLSLGLLPV